MEYNRENTSWAWGREESLKAQKAQPRKEMTYKFDYIKFKVFCLPRNTTQRVSTEWERLAMCTANRRAGSRMCKGVCKQFKRGRQHNIKLVHFTKEEIHVTINTQKSHQPH